MADIFKNIKGLFVTEDETQVAIPTVTPTMFPVGTQGTDVKPVSVSTLETDHGNVVEVDAIYSQDSVLMVGASHDIRVLDKYLGALPPTMDKETKKETLKNLLSVSSISVEKLQADKELRVGLLDSYQVKDAQESESLVAEATAKIGTLELAIEELKKLISEEQKRKIVQDEVIKVEIERLNKLATYLG